MMRSSPFTCTMWHAVIVYTPVCSTGKLQECTTVLVCMQLSLRWILSNPTLWLLAVVEKYNSLPTYRKTRVFLFLK